MKWVVAFALLSAASNAQAETSKELAEKSRLAWSAFECAALAATIEDRAQSERLFVLGYDAAKSFMEAYFAKKIAAEDLQSTAPWGMKSVMQGPNVDFMIGRLWETTAKEAHRLVYKDENGTYRPTDFWKTYATTEFQNRNCKLIH